MTDPHETVADGARGSPTPADSNENTCLHNKPWCTGADGPTPPCWWCLSEAAPGDRWRATGPVTVPDSGTDEDAITDLTALHEGDRVVWDGRATPGTVVYTTFGSHIYVEDLAGNLDQILPDPCPNCPAFRLARGGSVETLRRVERAPASERTRMFGRPGGGL